VKEIEIDTNRNASFQISAIAEKERIIPLTGIPLKAIFKVFYQDKLIFILGNKGDSPSLNVFLFDSTGKYLKTLGDETVGSFRNDIIVNQSTKEVYVLSGGTIYTYDYNGRFISKKKDDFGSYCICFNNQIWYCQNNFENNKINASLVCLDLEKRTRKTLYNWSKEGTIMPTAAFFVKGDKLYFNPKIDGTIYEATPTGIIPVLKFRFKNKLLDITSVRRLFNQGFLFDYYIWGYEIKQNWHYFFYNVKNGQSYNIKCGSYNNGLTSGIIDDVYKTGFTLPSTAINSPHLFFYKKASELSSVLKNNSAGAGTLFLLKKKTI
jgi:hypothetical protein